MSAHRILGLQQVPRVGLFENEVKRCPFRKDEDGEFAPCYGEGCMAYLEYDQPVFTLSTQCSVIPQPVHVAMCRRMAQPMPYSAISPSYKDLSEHYQSSVTQCCAKP